MADATLPAVDPNDPYAAQYDIAQRKLAKQKALDLQQNAETYGARGRFYSSELPKQEALITQNSDQQLSDVAQNIAMERAAQQLADKRTAEARAYQTSERVAGQTYSSGEALLGRQFTSGENAANRAYEGNIAAGNVVSEQDMGVAPTGAKEGDQVVGGIVKNGRVVKSTTQQTIAGKEYGANVATAGQEEAIAKSLGYTNAATMNLASPAEKAERLKFINAQPGAVINSDYLGYEPGPGWYHADARSNLWTKGTAPATGPGVPTSGIPTSRY